MKKNKIIMITIIIIITIAVTILLIFLLKNKTTILKKKIEVEGFSAPTLKLTEISNDIYSMKIPEGWKIETTGEYETFGFHLYDPNNKSLHIFYYGKFSPFLKSDTGKKFWQNYILNGGYISSKYLADAYVLNTPNVESFYSNFDNFTNYAKAYGINHNFPLLGNYKLVEKLNYSTPMKDVAKDEAILRLDLKQNNIDCEALVTASIVDAMSYNVNGADSGYYSVYVVSGIIAPVSDFKYLESILSESLSSFKYTEEYVQKGVEQNKWETKVAQEIGNMLSKANDSYNEAWSKRQQSYDALSEKRSDSTLGYDRLYDTDTGETYKAELGFYDEYKTNKEAYSNKNLELVPDSAYDLYNQTISGYIEK